LDCSTIRLILLDEKTGKDCAAGDGVTAGKGVLEPDELQADRIKLRRMHEIKRGFCFIFNPI